jgi:hypothetical protein
MGARRGVTVYMSNEMQTKKTVLQKLITNIASRYLWKSPGTDSHGLCFYDDKTITVHLRPSIVQLHTYKAKRLRDQTEKISQLVR